MNVQSIGSPGAASAAVVPQQYLRFALGDDAYAIGIDAVREILQTTAMTPVPLMPAFLRGVMNLRGAVVPVVNLGSRLGLRASDIGRRSCVVVVEVADAEDGAPSTLGVLVDAVYEVFETAQLEPAPAFGTPVDPGFIAGMARLDGQALVVLELPRVLAQEELAQLMASTTH